MTPALVINLSLFNPPHPPVPLPPPCVCVCFVQCKKEAKGLELVSISEYDVCKYRMILALPQWCNVVQ